MLDVLVWLATALAVMFAGVEIGIGVGVGVGLSILVVLLKVSPFDQQYPTGFRWRILSPIPSRIQSAQYIASTLNWRCRMAPRIGYQNRSVLGSTRSSNPPGF